MDDLKYIIKLLEEQGKKISRIENILASQQNMNLKHSKINECSTTGSQKILIETGSEADGDWYKKGTTIHKILSLIPDGFFDVNRTVKDLIIKLKSQDLHFKPEDLTLPLRKIVRRGALIKTMNLPDGTTSTKWTYVKN